MQYQEQHTMVLFVEHPDGSQEWHCPTCGRRFLIKWPPNYNRIILEEGDPNAIHSSESSVADPFQPQEIEPEMIEDVNDPYLAPFREWMEKYGG